MNSVPPPPTPLPSDVWLVVPAYNEATVIASVLQRVRLYTPNIVVVDDCSTDSTAEEIRKAAVPMVRHHINLGQGAALQTGIQYALSRGAQVIVTFDSDGQHNPEDIPALISPIQAGEADVVLGTRFQGSGEAQNIPPARRFLLQGATLFTRITTGLKISDTHNGFRAFSREAAQRIHITLNRMAHASQILSQIAEKRLRYCERPVRIIYTDYSLAKGQKIGNFFNIVWDSLMGVLRR